MLLTSATASVTVGWCDRGSRNDTCSGIIDCLCSPSLVRPINRRPSNSFVWKELSLETQNLHSFLSRRPQHYLRTPDVSTPGWGRCCTVHFDKKHLAVLSGKHIHSLKNLGSFRNDHIHAWDLCYRKNGVIMGMRRACR
jgi:hypothetical protein